MAHLAPSLVRLRDEVNATWPGRSRASDGWIGDAAHASRASDHNPDGAGRVHAIDVTVAGIDKARLIARAIADPRTAYVISDRRIWENPAAYPGRGYWRVYVGTNPHTAHVHISSRRGSWADSTASWGVSTVSAVGGPIIVLPPVQPGDPIPTPTPITPTPIPEDDDMFSDTDRGTLGRAAQDASDAERNALEALKRATLAEEHALAARQHAANAERNSFDTLKLVRQIAAAQGIG